MSVMMMEQISIYLFKRINPRYISYMKMCMIYFDASYFDDDEIEHFYINGNFPIGAV